MWPPVVWVTEEAYFLLQDLNLPRLHFRWWQHGAVDGNKRETDIYSVSQTMPKSLYLCSFSFSKIHSTQRMNTWYWEFWPIFQLSTPPHTIRDSTYLEKGNSYTQTLNAFSFRDHNIVAIANLKSQQIQSCHSNAFLLLWGRGPV